MYLQKALEVSQIVKHKNSGQAVSDSYLRHFFSPVNPYNYFEWIEVYGYHVEISFEELISDQWEPVNG